MSEHEVYDTADMNIIMKCTEGWFKSTFNDKYDMVSFPLLERFPSISKQVFAKDEGKIHLLFAGSFIRDLRNPDFLLKLFTSLNNEKLVLHLYARGNCENIINKYVGVSNGRIISHGIVSIDDIHDAMQQADILVNVGNTVEEQLQSKIYEYISTGKPIVNIYCNNLSYEDIFSRYPLYLGIQEDFNRIEALRDTLLEFCCACKNRLLKYEDVEAMYYDSTPKNVAEIFMKHM
jgi:glycosyltransferase involved in cell wall biosynthesis